MAKCKVLDASILLLHRLQDVLKLAISSPDFFLLIKEYVFGKKEMKAPGGLSDRDPSLEGHPTEALPPIEKNP